jgi:murein DD-endopeptidase MepM/ murein hydrolase activator NlpD
MNAYRGLLVWLATAAIVSACGRSAQAPVAPSPGLEPASPAPGAQVFSVNMPLLLADAATAAYGLWPFGVHGSSHATDGHPGWDIEFRVGSDARAAADGTVQSVFTDPGPPVTLTLQVEHRVGDRAFRTVYNHLETLAPGIVPGAIVQAGQVIGTPTAKTLTIGSAPVTFAAIHFQLDDFSQSSGLTNVHAVSPEGYLSAAGSAVFEAIWTTAAYNRSSASRSSPTRGT